jgi:hypothetical protein
MDENRNNQNGENNEEFLFKTVMEGKEKSRVWSVASIAMAIAALLCSMFIYPAIVLGALAIIFALFSRKNIGYFDGLAIAGLIIGIAGVVFGVGGFLLSYVVEGSEWYSQLTWQIENPGTSGGGALPPDVT